MKIKTIYTLLLFTCFSLSAQEVEFEKTFGGPNNEQGFSILQLPDSSFVISGATKSYSSSGNGDFYLLKTNHLGEETWFSVANDADESESCFAMTLTNDNGFLLVGNYRQSNSNFLFQVQKYDSNGNLEWLQVYGGNDVDMLQSVVQGDDGFYYAAGFTTSMGAGEYDMSVLKLDQSGNQIWWKTYGDSGADRAFDILKTSDGNLIISGHSEIPGGPTPTSAMWIKIDTNGDVIWSNHYESDFGSSPQSFNHTSDGGYIFAGSSQAPSSGNQNDLLVVKLDTDGEQEWAKTYEGNSFINGSSIQQTSDGGYIVTGNRTLAGSSADLYALKLDDEGLVEWDLILGGNSLDYGLDVKQTLDGGYIISGTNSDTGSEDIYLVKIKGEAPVSISGPEQNEIKIRLSPNPTIGQINIQFSDVDNATVELYNLAGILVDRLTNQNRHALFNMTELPPGQYWVKVSSEEGVSVLPVVR